MQELRRLNRSVSGILFDADGRVLVTERLGDPAFAGFWEFPGGKIGSGESPAAALRRELSEELGIVVEACDLLMSLEHHYPDRRVSIDFFRVESWRGIPQGLEGQAIRWVSTSELPDIDLLPADQPVIETLIRPAR